MASSPVMGRCIYCFTDQEPLDREHMFPKGLSGNIVLQRASCKPCSRITSAFEGRVLREQLRPIRAYLGMSSYDKSEWPRAYPVNVGKTGELDERLVELAKYPAMLAMPVWGPPLALPASIEAENDHLLGMAHFPVTPGGWPAYSKQMEQLAKELGVDELGVRVGVWYQDWAKLLGKIAYCSFVAEAGLDALDECYVLPDILDKPTSRPRFWWIGCVGYAFMPSPAMSPVRQFGWIQTEAPEVGRQDHFLGPELQVQVVDTMPGGRLGKIAANEVKGYILEGVVQVNIRLFSNFGTPEYTVLIGRPKPNLVKQIWDDRGASAQQYFERKRQRENRKRERKQHG